MAKWEIRIERQSEQTGSAGTRTVGTYQVYHDGVKAAGTIRVDGVEVPLSGTTAESPGPSQNDKPATSAKPSRILAKSYEMQTSGGPMYVTDGYRQDLAIDDGMPGLELTGTGNRTAILIHPGKDKFLSSIGCINLCTRLPDAGEIINYPGSRRRVIALIEDMRAFLGGLPGPDQAIEGAAVSIDETALAKPKAADGAADAVAAKKEAAATAATAPKGIGWPLKHNMIRRNAKSNTFGLVRHKADGSLKPHQGWDFEAPIGTPCFAIADGKVALVYASKDYGNVAVLGFPFNGKTYYAAYAHLNAVAVASGQAIAKGEKIGLTGDTGNAKGMTGKDLHLHFEIRTEPRPGLGLSGRTDPAKIFGAMPLNAPVDV